MASLGARVALLCALGGMMTGPLELLTFFVQLVGTTAQIYATANIIDRRLTPLSNDIHRLDARTWLYGETGYLEDAERPYQPKAELAKLLEFARLPRSNALIYSSFANTPRPFLDTLSGSPDSVFSWTEPARTGDDFVTQVKEGQGTAVLHSHEGAAYLGWIDRDQSLEWKFGALPLSTAELNRLARPSGFIDDLIRGAGDLGAKLFR